LFVASLAVPENAAQIDAAILHALGAEGVLINISRGFLIDEVALVSALATRTIAGAALDVFEHEPTEPARWRGLPNVVLSPHLAGYTYEAGEALFGQLRANIERHFRGAPLVTPVDGLPGRL
jgi:phosphoglycerate dehydrogenase-like enzyme